MKSKTDSMKNSVDNVRTQLSGMGNQIQSYLQGVDANIEAYKFNVEQIEGGMRIDIEFKAKVTQKSVNPPIKACRVYSSSFDSIRRR